MKKIIAIIFCLIVLPLSLAGCNGCGSGNKEYAGTYTSGSEFSGYTLTLTSAGKFTYKRTNAVADDPETVSGTFTIDQSAEPVKITLKWRDTTSYNPSDVETTGTFSKDGQTLTIKIYGEKTFKKN